MCCGQKRSLLNNPAARSRPQSLAPQAGINGRQPALLGRPATSPAISPSPGDIAVRYLKSAPVRVRGLISGRCYEFTGARCVAEVDPRDFPGLLNTGLFRRG